MAGKLSIFFSKIPKYDKVEKRGQISGNQVICDISKKEFIWQYKYWCFFLGGLVILSDLYVCVSLLLFYIKYKMQYSRSIDWILSILNVQVRFKKNQSLSPPLCLSLSLSVSVCLCPSLSLCLSVSLCLSLSLSVSPSVVLPKSLGPLADGGGETMHSAPTVGRPPSQRGRKPGRRKTKLPGPWGSKGPAAAAQSVQQGKGPEPVKIPKKRGPKPGNKVS